ncbi:MAG: hypothetical protein A2231_11925 [Candidatus Firestonebacteria bacterium RIFOXYA2_FULL_40_8]|nr:MAG: hypothetical protein A2231_11925 [Candidatus Firestonebacteria bacterium RIFOXYA2_FULL_40_8]
MKRKSKKKIISIFKRPTTIIIIFVIAWAVFAGLSTSFILSRVKREFIAATGDILDNLKNKYVRGRTVIEDVEVYNKLKIIDVKCRASASGKEEIVTGRIINDSEKRLGKLKIKLSFVDGAGEAIEVLEYEDVVSLLEAKGSAEFSVLRKLTGEKKRCVSVKGVVSDFNVVE